MVLVSPLPLPLALDGGTVAIHDPPEPAAIDLVPDAAHRQLPLTLIGLSVR